MGFNGKWWTQILWSLVGREGHILWGLVGSEGKRSYGA